MELFVVLYLIMTSGAGSSVAYDVKNPPCGVTGEVTGVQYDRSPNPTKVYWPDPYFPGAHCVVDVENWVLASAPGTYHFATTMIGPEIPIGVTVPHVFMHDPHVSPDWVRQSGGPPPPTCPITIRVDDWTKSVAVGGRGKVSLQLANSQPVVRLQVLLGTQVIGEVTGTDLRDLSGLYFSVPRTPGAYNITVAAQDSACTAKTTAVRVVNVQ